MKYLNVTQGVLVGTHKGSYAVDVAGKDYRRDNVFAPFTGVVKKIWANGNTVWLQSLAPVLFADGTIDYAVASFTHDDDVSDLKVGQVIQQGQVFYQEGMKGFVTGNHVHLEIGRGKFTGTGWYNNSFGFWTINRKYLPHKAFFLDGTIIINTGGYAWKRTAGGNMSKDRTINQVFMMGLSRKPDPGALSTYRQTTDEVTVNAIYVSTERANKLKSLGIVGGNWVGRISGLKKTVAARDVKIGELNGTVGALKGTVADQQTALDAYSTTATKQQKTIIELTDKLSEFENRPTSPTVCESIKQTGWITLIVCKLRRTKHV